MGIGFSPAHHGLIRPGVGEMSTYNPTCGSDFVLSILPSPRPGHRVGTRLKNALQTQKCAAMRRGLLLLGPGAGPHFLSLVFGFPYHPLNTKKGTLFIPRLLLGLVPTARSRAEPLKAWTSLPFLELDLGIFTWGPLYLEFSGVIPTN